MLDKLAGFADKHDLFPEEGVIIAAVSGGADSMCLLTALLELSATRGFSVAAAHYNHQLRGSESDRDAAFVERFCAERKVPLYSGAGDVSAFARAHKLGTEDAARRLRYDFLYETAKIIDAKRIATAHTADDNAETVLLNLTRGAGLNGLGGIPPKRGPVIRPMLTVTRHDILAFLSQRGVSYVEDSSNQDVIYSRNRIRRDVIPVLKTLNPQLTAHITTTVGLLREDEAYLNSVAEQYVETHGVNTPDSWVFNAAELADLPKPIGSRVIRRVFGNNLSSEHICAVLALCKSGDTSGEVTLPSGLAYREYGGIVFSEQAHSCSFSPAEVMMNDKIDIPELRLTVKCRSTDADFEKINKTFNTFLFKKDNICGKIVIRPRETGDKIELFGRNGTKTLKKLYIEHRIPMRKRPLIPVISDEKGVLAVYGIGYDIRTACKAGDRALEIIFEETAYEE